MKTGVVLALSFLALVLGNLFLVWTLSNPSLDVWILARDLCLSLAAVSAGVAAPLLHREFAGDEGEAGNN